MHNWNDGNEWIWDIEWKDGNYTFIQLEKGVAYTLIGIMSDTGDSISWNDEWNEENLIWKRKETGYNNVC